MYPFVRRIHRPFDLAETTLVFLAMRGNPIDTAWNGEPHMTEIYVLVNYSLLKYAASNSRPRT